MNLFLAFMVTIFASADAGSPRLECTRIRVKVTAYCPCARCCGVHADGRTATGRNAYRAGVAVDPSIISLGSRLDIPNYPRGPNGNGSWIIADDVGGAIDGHHIDVRFRGHYEALKWAGKYGGYRTVRVWRWVW